MNFLVHKWGADPSPKECLPRAFGIGKRALSVLAGMSSRQCTPEPERKVVAPPRRRTDARHGAPGRAVIGSAERDLDRETARRICRLDGEGERSALPWAAHYHRALTRAFFLP